MKKFTAVLFLCFSLLVLSEFTHAQQTGIGVGGILNGPTGLSMKGWVSEDLAFDAALGLNLGENFQSVYIHSNILYHNNTLNEKLNLDNSSLRSYYGAGIRLVIQDFNDVVGIRFPVGLSYSLNNAPLGTFFELAPTFDLEPGFRFTFDGAIGLRYYLN